jgi:hypothetical protein
MQMNLPALEMQGTEQSAKEPEAPSPQAAQKQQVEGQKLEQVEKVNTDTSVPWKLYFVLLMCFFLVLIGVFKQSMMISRSNNLSFAYLGY